MGLPTDLRSVKQTPDHSRLFLSWQSCIQPQSSILVHYSLSQ